ncbi:hypothetical protein BKA70DRAFT_1442962 [Coprinopsis sp. MPI-PUGE-AT-0042]|nr:hypothetical protein BKA70DRAFT_1442962 [Coprinopsis sp. MPI-PUGE-AT-0042]
MHGSGSMATSSGTEAAIQLVRRTTTHRRVRKGENEGRGGGKKLNGARILLTHPTLFDGSHDYLYCHFDALAGLTWLEIKNRRPQEGHYGETRSPFFRIRDGMRRGDHLNSFMSLRRMSLIMNAGEDHVPSLSYLVLSTTTVSPDQESGPTYSTSGSNRPWRNICPPSLPLYNEVHASHIHAKAPTANKVVGLQMTEVQT